MNISTLFSLLKQTVAEWQHDKVSRLAAALAYYTIFSLAPILIIAIAVASFLFEQNTVKLQLISQMQGLLGESAAELVEQMLTNQSQGDEGFWATMISVGLLIVGASGLFIQLQDALNTVWNVTPKKDGGFGKLIRDRLLSFGMVLVIGFLLLVSLMISAGLAATATLFGGSGAGVSAGGLSGWVIGAQVLNMAVSFGIITLLFGLIYKVLPDVKVAWSDVWVGAAMTALLFTFGKLAIGLYLGNSTVASAYGAAGSLIVLLLWVYYSAQILLFGAEFTQVYANRFGDRITPDKHAVFTAGTTALEKGETAPEQFLELSSEMPQTRSQYKVYRRVIERSPQRPQA